MLRIEVFIWLGMGKQLGQTMQSRMSHASDFRFVFTDVSQTPVLNIIII